MKKFLWMLTIIMIFIIFAIPLSAAEKFSDVKDNDWFAPFVYDLVELEILNGKGDGKFDPNGDIKRGEFVKILAYASQDDLSKYQGQSKFTDSRSHWSETNINWAYENGIVNGQSETSFAPEAKITRQEMAAMIYRYANYKDLALPQDVKPVDFKDDGDIASWAKEAVSAMQQAKIISGYPEGTFLPKNNATRGEAAKMISVFLTRAVKKEVNEKTYQEFMDKNVDDFDTDHVLNFDENKEDNFAVIRDDVELVQDNDKNNELISADEGSGTYIFTNIDESIKNLQPGDKFVIYGDDYEDCVSLVVDQITVNGSTATITSQGGEIEDFFEYIQLDMEIPVSPEYLDTSTLPEGATLENVSENSATISEANLNREISQIFEFGMNFQIGGIKTSGSTKLEITVNAVVDWDPNLFGKDYLKCDMKATVENTNDLTLELTESGNVSNLVEIPLGELNIPLGTTGLFVTGDLNFIIDFDGSVTAEIDSTSTKTTGFTYNTNVGFHKIDEMTTKDLETVIKAEGTVSGGVEAGLALSLVKVVEAKVSAEAGVEAEAIADLVGGDTKHTCFLCFEGELYKYAQCEFKVKAGFGVLSVTPVDLTLARWEDKINDFYCSLADEYGTFGFGWGDCPNRNGGGEDPGGEGDDNPSSGNIIDSGTCGENLTWTLDEYGTLTISGTGAMSNYGASSAVPWNAYKNNIKQIILTSGVTNIGSYAFADCFALTLIEIPNSVVDIHSYAFINCESLINIIIPDNVINIGGQVFQGCKALESVMIGSNVSHIGGYTFAGCHSLTEIRVKNDNPYFKSIDGVLFSKNGSELLSFPNGKQGDYIIPSSTTIISNYAFHGGYLESVIIPNSVVTIGEGAFEDCNLLTSVTITDSITTIPYRAFYSCDSLKSIILPMSITLIESEAFVYCYDLKNVYYEGSAIDRSKITIWSNNFPILNATWYYNYQG